MLTIFAAFFARNFHSGVVCKILNSLDKSAAFIFHKKAYSIARGAAAETVVKLLVWTYAKRRRFLIVKWAASAIIFSCFFQLNPRVNNRNNINTRDKIVYERSGDASTASSSRSIIHGLASQLSLYDFRYLPHIRAALHLRLYDCHNFAHVLHSRCASFSNRVAHDGGDLVFA